MMMKQEERTKRCIGIPVSFGQEHTLVVRIPTTRSDDRMSHHKAIDTRNQGFTVVVLVFAASAATDAAAIATPIDATAISTAIDATALSYLLRINVTAAVVLEDHRTGSTGHIFHLFFVFGHQFDLFLFLIVKLFEVSLGSFTLSFFRFFLSSPHFSRARRVVFLGLLTPTSLFLNHPSLGHLIFWLLPSPPPLPRL